MNKTDFSDSELARFFLDQENLPLDLYSSSKHFVLSATVGQILTLITYEAIRPVWVYPDKKVISSWFLNWTKTQILDLLLRTEDRKGATGSKTYYKERISYYHRPEACNAFRRDGQEALKSLRFAKNEVHRAHPK